MSGRDKLSEIREPEREALRSQLKQLGLTESQWKAVARDIPLIEAALATDRVVVSCDDTARNSFHGLASRCPELSSVAWVNPSEDPENVLRWLAEGAQRRADLLVGS